MSGIISVRWTGVQQNNNGGFHENTPKEVTNSSNEFLEDFETYGVLLANFERLNTS